MINILKGEREAISNAFKIEDDGERASTTSQENKSE
jgi:hypothetical protein